MTSLEEAKNIAKILDKKKAIDIIGIETKELTVMSDYFIIANGTNRSQIQALADNVQEKLGKAGHICKQMEGYQTANWVLLGFGDVIVHIFDAKNRLLYDLERIWRDGVQIPAEEL